MSTDTLVYDVVVVGGGGSGLATALSAAQAGCSIALLEKNAECGGTTGLAVGSFTAAGTRLQKAAGIEDTAEDHIVDVQGFAPEEIEARNNDDLRAFFLQHAGEAWNWLEELGLVFQGPMPEPPNRQPRMHNVVPKAHAYIATFLRHFKKHRNSAIFCNCKVEELLSDDDLVIGVRAATPKGSQIFRANYGVVLAAGDFAAAQDLIERFKGPDYTGMHFANPTATGDGQRLIENIGGNLVNMDVIYGPELRFPPLSDSIIDHLPTSSIFGALIKFILPLLPAWIVRWVAKRRIVSWQHPENDLFNEGALLLNCLGNRFCNEVDTKTREQHLARQPDAAGWILLDARLQQLFSDWPHFVSTAPRIAYAYVKDYKKLRPDLCIEGETLEQLATRSGMQLDNLKSAVDDYNATIRNDGNDTFNHTSSSQELKGPWLLLGPTYPYITITEGGAMVDEKLRVLRPDGAPIPGLYAVGQNGNGGQILFGHGLHIGWAITSGYLLGKQLAKKTSPVLNE